MSAHNPCICKGKDRRKNWVVIHRNCNYSYFESPKGCRHFSEYSLIMCQTPGCKGFFRTKASYVYGLPDEEIK